MDEFFALPYMCHAGPDFSGADCLRVYVVGTAPFMLDIILAVAGVFIGLKLLQLAIRKVRSAIN